MNNSNDFDKIISGKLENILPEIPDNTWDSFQQYLEAHHNFEQLEFDISFDDKVREESKKMESGIPSDNWVALKNVLQLIEDRKKDVTVSAFSQIIIVCLIIQILLPGIQLINPNKIYEINYAGVAKKPYNGNEVTSMLHFTDLVDTVSYTEFNPQFKNSISYSFESYSSMNTIADNSGLQSTDVVIKSEPDTIKETSVAGETIGESEFSESEMSISELTAPGIEVDIPQSDNINYSSYKEENIDPYLDFDNEGSPAYSENVAYVPLENRRNTFVFSVTGFYSSDVNLINTPFDKVYSVASYTREAFNRSAGILFSMQRQNISLETGARYTHLIYTPKIIKEEHNQVADIFFETSLDRIAFKIIHIPLHLKYHFLNSRKWGGYLLLGAGFNLITESDFNITTSIRQGRNAGLRSPDQDLRLIEEKRFNAGIFEGGGINENYFVTGALGFGLERHISGTLKIFTQAVYNRHLFSDDIGIGPNKDKIHTMSFQSGLRIVL